LIEANATKTINNNEIVENSREGDSEILKDLRVSEEREKV
jgi:hypothetical protein